MKRILWFRRDLRVSDHPLLNLDSNAILPLFIFDSHLLRELPSDDLRISFIFNQLLTLKNELKSFELDLAVFHGNPCEVFTYLKHCGMEEIYASGDYDSYALERDSAVSKILPLKILQDTYLFTPDELLKQDGSPYKVFTPFYKNTLKQLNESHYMEYKKGKNHLFSFTYDALLSVEKDTVQKYPLVLESLGFREQNLSIDSPSKTLDIFKSKINSYEEKRDELKENSASRLGVHLRFGTISIRSILRILFQWKQEHLKTEPFLRQLIWREFYAAILYHFPHSESENFLPIKPQWDENQDAFESWCQGKTGIPIVDAAMRELNSSGNMHNRGRMITASFLTKDLHIDWRWGERYFASKLMDYDAASNIGSWQWAASTGTDAQPYFRIFNPYLQSKKFDSDGSYIKRFIPELELLSASKLHNESWLLSNTVSGYPKPIILHKIESQKAIQRFKELNIHPNNSNL